MLTAIVIVVVAAYLLFHGHRSRRVYRRHGHLPFGARVRVSVPGPFHTYISRTWR